MADPLWRRPRRASQQMNGCPPPSGVGSASGWSKFHVPLAQTRVEAPNRARSGRSAHRARVPRVTADPLWRRPRRSAQQMDGCPTTEWCRVSFWMVKVLHSARLTARRSSDACSGRLISAHIDRPSESCVSVTMLDSRCLSSNQSLYDHRMT